jgi:hypothetical protein
MDFLIADSLTPPPGLASWMACLAFLMVMLNQGWKHAGNLRGRPSGMELRQEVHASFLPRQDFEHFRGAIEIRLSDLETDTEERDRALRIDLAQMEARLNAASERRLDEFNKRLIEQIRELARIQGRLES